MNVCPNEDCPVHTFGQREPIPGCPHCETPGRIVPCPECLGTGLRTTPGRDRTLVCTGCDYRIDLDTEAPAFLGWVEKMTEQANLERWGLPRPRMDTETGWRTPDDDTVRWHLDAALDQLRVVEPHDLAGLDPDADLFMALFTRSLVDVGLTRHDHQGRGDGTATGGTTDA